MAVVGHWDIDIGGEEGSRLPSASVAPPLLAVETGSSSWSTTGCAPSIELTPDLRIWAEQQGFFIGEIRQLLLALSYLNLCAHEIHAPSNLEDELYNAAQAICCASEHGPSPSSRETPPLSSPCHDRVFLTKTASKRHIGGTCCTCS